MNISSKIMISIYALHVSSILAMNQSEELKRQIREAEEEALYIRSCGLNHIESYRELLESDERFLKGVEEDAHEQKSTHHNDSDSSCTNQESVSTAYASSEEKSWSLVQEDVEQSEEDWSWLEESSEDSWSVLKDDIECEF
jgi:hypothetical protein